MPLPQASRACQALWSELPHLDVDHLTIANALTMERNALMPMVPAFDGYLETVAPVSNTWLVSVEPNKCSVPLLSNGESTNFLLSKSVESARSTKNASTMIVAITSARSLSRSETESGPCPLPKHNARGAWGEKFRVVLCARSL